MDETAHSSNSKNSILLSRNSPVALVVGAAGFLGSHLVDKLLDKDIQVIGVDDLAHGEKFNLRQATENRNFHLVIESPENLNLDLPRLDYIFVVPQAALNLSKIFEIFKDKGSRCLLVSSIDLYEASLSKNFHWLRETESRIAKFANEHHLNARVLRLGPVYGPRMDFKLHDPIIKLITQALKGELQKEVSLDFSSRALFISDAVDLMIRTIFAGSTAQKIFDGVLPTPVKVAEIKQVLLDPIWYEEKAFEFSELPPWPTPNLEKTIKTLNWHPRPHILGNLKKTLQFFKDNEIEVPEIVTEKEVEVKPEEESWNQEKREVLEAFKQEGEENKNKPAKKGSGFKKFSLSGITLVLVLALVTYALVWPALVLGWGIFSFRYQLNQSLNNLNKGDSESSLKSINLAAAGVEEAKSIYESLDPLRRSGLLKEQFELGDGLIELSLLSVAASKKTALGMQALLQSVKAVTGEKSDSPEQYFETARMELGGAGESLSKAETILKGENFKRSMPRFFKGRIKDLSEKLSLYSKLATKAEAVSTLLPKMVGMDGPKKYLVLLQNNMELRPGGGFIGSFAEVSFEGGKFKKLEVNDIYAIDGQLKVHVEPPVEINKDLGQKDFFLRDSNWEPDFPTAARQAEWFYTKETGKSVEGVVALDISAMEELLSVIGPLDLTDYKEKITAENLFEKAVSHAETSFFPGTQAKKSFLTALTNGVFEKLFFVPQNNWPAIISTLGKSLEEKHLSFYLNDPKQFSFLVAQDLTHVLPRQTKENDSKDFLSLIEANLGANKVNYYLDRTYNLHTIIGKEGDVSHRLRINYVNRSPSEAFPGGKYKNRMRVYLPFGAKLTRAIWGETDITASVNGFVDFGRTGYSFLVELYPKEQKTLVVDYTVPVKLSFTDNKATYRLDIIKQAGMGKDPLQWSITYPISFKAANPLKTASPQEQTISTDLSRDRSFEMEFRK